ncbi:uncharacterized protein LOC126712980 isoform X2 [Quercus robur]|uniref:uncharacterized protein LOC126712980 isoform X2 n=1 Tax=Quercus robur TaxID=38942 RepID=UPI0021614FF3|nr:uncharacterized protein LOC126712980 isoform X2 [Quercus robur]
MRFMKGSKVEVLKNKQVPPGEWHCAKIISGNGHTYSVMYEGSLELRSEAVVERVPRKAIRPCPPPVESVEGWAVGDVAEVFDAVSWRMAMILKVLGGNCHLVRLLGSYEKFRVHKSNIRVRQIWQDDKWVVIRKGSQNCELVKFNKPSSLNCHQMSPEFAQLDTRRKMQAGNTCLAAQDNTCLQESHIVSCRTLKRASHYCSSHTEAYSGKMRAIENEGEQQRVISESPSPLLKKKELQEGNYMSFKNKGCRTLFVNVCAGIRSTRKDAAMQQWPSQSKHKRGPIDTFHVNLILSNTGANE